MIYLQFTSIRRVLVWNIIIIGAFHTLDSNHAFAIQFFSNKHNSSPLHAQTTKELEPIQRNETRQHLTTKIVGGFAGYDLPIHRHTHHRFNVNQLNMAMSSRRIKENSKRFHYIPDPSRNRHTLKEHWDKSDDYFYPRQTKLASSMDNNRRKLPFIQSSSRLRPGKSSLSSSSVASAELSTSGSLSLTAVAQWVTLAKSKVAVTVRGSEMQDFLLLLAYMCTQFANTIPILLLPMIAADPYASLSGASLAPKLEIGKMVAVCSLGGALGKFVNGFICQGLGGRLSGGIYLLGLSIFSMMLSTTSSIHSYAMAGMEFCTSMLWTACTVIIANKYSNDPKKFSSVLMTLSLGSTGGVLLAKTIGSACLRSMHWRTVAQFSAGTALFASTLLLLFIQENNTLVKKRHSRSITLTKGQSETAKVHEDGGLTLGSIWKSASNVMGNSKFWMIAFAHACAFLARSSDKILGTFIMETAGLPNYICGSLTSSVTIGFVVGLISGKRMNDLGTFEEKSNFTSQLYQRAVLAACGLALCANKAVGSLLGSVPLAAVITLLSGFMASSVAFQFYQFPSLFGKTFNDDKAICISMMDGIGLLLVSPVFTLISKIVASGQFGTHGWSIAWLAIAGMFGAGGKVMKKALPSVLQEST